MSKLEELIAELCPGGVEYKTFGEIATILRGASPRPIKNFITSDEDGVNWIKIGDVAVGSKYVTHANEKITAKGAEKSRKVKKGDFILSNSMSFGRPYILAIDGCIHDGWLAISDFNDTFVTDFLYYLLNSTAVQQEMAKRASFGGAVQNLNADIVKSLMLPIPPLPVQSEIVRILDNFTEITAELTAELTARKKQYEYYRSEILRSSKLAETKTLGEVCDFVRGPFGGSLKKEIFTRDGYAVYEQQHAIYGKFQFRYFVDEQKFKEMRRFEVKPGDLIMSCSGTMGEIAIIPADAPEGIINQALLKLTPKEGVNNRFLKYCFEDSIAAQMNSNARGGAIKNVASVAVLKDIEIQIPSIDEQLRIVDVLDRFDALCNNITTGLPAEIEARTKQYEYYRDKLLTFKELT
jgi:type I restriction enzyme, S subunit